MAQTKTYNYSMFKGTPLQGAGQLFGSIFGDPTKVTVKANQKGAFEGFGNGAGVANNVFQAPKGNDAPAPAATYSGGANTRGYAPSYNQETVNQFDQAIGTTNAALGRTDNQLNIALSNIAKMYGQRTNEQDSAKKQANADQSPRHTSLVLASR